jgi:hypothetical protein
MKLSLKFTFYLLIAGSLLPSSLFAGKGRSGKEITWSTGKIIDGLNNDWDPIYPYSDDKANIQYAFSNDSNNLYISVKTSERVVQMKILSGGLITWIDTNAKKGTDIGIAFPLKGANTEGFKMPKGQNNNTYAPGKPGASDISEMMNNMVARSGIMQLIGFPECPGQLLIREQNSCGIEVGLLYNEFGELVYEASIPLKYLTVASPGRSVIAVGFEIAELQRPQLAERPGQDAPPQGMGRGGGGVNASFGGMSGGGGGNMLPPGNGPNGGGPPPEIDSKLFEATSTWEKIIPALNLANCYGKETQCNDPDVQ